MQIQMLSLQNERLHNDDYTTAFQCCISVAFTAPFSTHTTNYEKLTLYENMLTA